MKHLGSGWGKAFQRRLPIILKGFTVNAARIMREFHEVIETEARLQGIGIAGMNMLSQQLNNYTATLKDVADQMIVVIAEMQRNANREFVPVVQSHMLPAYEVCTDERGKRFHKKLQTIHG